jgi:deoxyhypusine synthase
LVIGTTNALQNVVIPSTNATALTVGGGVSIGGNLIITNRMKLTGLDTTIYIGENSQQNTGQRNVC